MDPVTVTCEGVCTVTHVITFASSIFEITPSQGGAIAGAILALWALAWGFRALIQTLRGTDGDSSTSSDKD